MFSCVVLTVMVRYRGGSPVRPFRAPRGQEDRSEAAGFPGAEDGGGLCPGVPRRLQQPGRELQQGGKRPRAVPAEGAGQASTKDCQGQKQRQDQKVSYDKRQVQCRVCDVPCRCVLYSSLCKMYSLTMCCLVCRVKYVLCKVWCAVCQVHNVLFIFLPRERSPSSEIISEHKKVFSCSFPSCAKTYVKSSHLKVQETFPNHFHSAISCSEPSPRPT